MRRAVLFVFSCFMGSFAPAEVILMPDKPFMKAKLHEEATLECCYKNGPKTSSWVKVESSSSAETQVNSRDQTLVIHNNKPQKDNPGVFCGTLTFKKAMLNDTGMYLCCLGRIRTHGTYFYVYKPIDKFFNLSESTKNSILTAEGVLLLLCVILPSVPLLLKKRNLRQLEMSKLKKEEENIYQGLNLDETCTTYDQIERPQARGQYQDVGQALEEEIQLEKP